MFLSVIRRDSLWVYDPTGQQLKTNGTSCNLDSFKFDKFNTNKVSPGPKPFFLAKVEQLLGILQASQPH